MNKEKITEMELEIYDSEEKIKEKIKECEGKHIQQVVYSTYHNAFTQICFGCKKVRTTLKLNEIKSKKTK